MKSEYLVSRLDEEFGMASNAESIVEFAVTNENRDLMNPEFLTGKTGLMLDSSETVDRVVTAVFISAGIVASTLRHTNALLFTHHPFDYFEDGRGLRPVAPGVLKDLQANGVSIYAAHGPLDTHAAYGTSLALARSCGIEIQECFYDYFGAPAAVFGKIELTDFETFAESVRTSLERPCLTLHKHRPSVKRLAVAAGGGSLPDLLQMAHDHGCDTLLTGTVENRWAVPFFQEVNRQFHELNAKLKLNLIGGTHFGTERPAMIGVVDMFKEYGVPREYCEDEDLLTVL